jgi:hypothetical protein
LCSSTLASQESAFCRSHANQHTLPSNHLGVSLHGESLSCMPAAIHISMVQVAIHASAHLVLLRCRPYLAARHFSAVAYLNTQASLTIVSHCAFHRAARNSSLAVFSCSPACWCSPKLVDVNVSCMSLCGAAVPAVLAEGLKVEGRSPAPLPCQLCACCSGSIPCWSAAAGA